MHEHDPRSLPMSWLTLGTAICDLFHLDPMRTGKITLVSSPEHLAKLNIERYVYEDELPDLLVLLDRYVLVERAHATMLQERRPGSTYCHSLGCNRPPSHRVAFDGGQEFRVCREHVSDYCTFESPMRISPLGGDA